MAEAFEDRHVVVTGGSGALGSAVVARLLEAGAVAHVPVLFEQELERFPFAENPRVRLARGVDLGDADAVAAFYAAIPAPWASIQCAGGFAMAPLADTAPEALRRLMTLNLETCFLCCRQAVIRMRETGGDGGRLVNVAARPALEPRTGAGMAAYTASKAAVAALTVSLGEELAAEGIWVNAVAPSILDTPANRAAMPDADHRLWPSTDEVAATIVFLAAPDNRTTRSAVVPVYGRS